MTHSSFQIKSMTAYGRGTAACEYGRFVVEIQSVNRRFVEMNLTLPRQLMRFETLMRKKINASVGRGMLQVVVYWKMDQKQSLSVTPNFPLARAIKGAWEELANR